MSDAPVSDGEIDDPENYGSSKRLQQIYDARRELREIRQEAATHRTRMPKKALAYYRTGVESYLMELDTLFQRDKKGQYLWTEQQFGTIRIDPPQTPEKSYHSINSYSEKEPQIFEIRGLATLFEVDTEITHVFEFEDKHELTGTKTRKVERSAMIPWDVLNKMVAVANRYVSNLGIGLEIDDEKHTWQFDEFADEDILDEVDGL